MCQRPELNGGQQNLESEINKLTHVYVKQIFHKVCLSQYTLHES
jgi:hypothetical protein